VWKKPLVGMLIGHCGFPSVFLVPSAGQDRKSKNSNAPKKIISI